jgi:hypothetical protein
LPLLLLEVLFFRAVRLTTNANFRNRLTDRALTT